MKTVDERRKSWCDFYKPDGKTKFVYLVSCGEMGCTYPRPYMWPQFKKERIEWAWNSYLADVERIKWIDDYSIPFLSVTSGTEIFAEAFGTKVYRPNNDMPFAIPFVKSPSEAEKIRVPKLEDTPLMHLFDIADELVRRAGKNVPLQLPDMQSPMDVVAQIWDKTDLFPSMIEAPDEVKNLAEKVKALQFAFLDEWFSRYGTAYIAHFPTYYMEKGITVSVDEIGSVSTEMYDEFFAKELDEMSKRYGGIGIHCCADSRHQWANLKKTDGLVMLNFCRPINQLDESYEFFKDSVAMWPMAIENNAGSYLPIKRKDEYPEGSHIVFTTGANTKEETIQLVEKLKNEYGE